MPRVINITFHLDEGTLNTKEKAKKIVEYKLAVGMIVRLLKRWYVSTYSREDESSVYKSIWSSIYFESVSKQNSNEYR